MHNFLSMWSTEQMLYTPGYYAFSKQLLYFYERSSYCFKVKNKA